MKVSSQSFEEITGVRKRARFKKRERRPIFQYFKKPIVHKQIHGEKVYVPLNIERVWNQI